MASTPAQTTEEDEEEIAPERPGALLDTNAVIAAIEGGNAPAVLSSLGGAIPYVSPTVVSEFVRGNGNLNALNVFLAQNGGNILGAELEGNAAALQAQASLLGRSLGANDAAIASAAQSMGIPIITNDVRFSNFLNQAGIGGRGF